MTPEHVTAPWPAVSNTTIRQSCCCRCAPRSRPQDYYELGVILTRKKLFTQATKNLEKAKKLWDGEESDLAQVCGGQIVRGYRVSRNSVQGLQGLRGLPPCSAATTSSKAPWPPSIVLWCALSCAVLTCCTSNHPTHTSTGAQCAGLLLLQHGEDRPGDRRVPQGRGPAVRLRDGLEQPG